MAIPSKMRTYRIDPTTGEKVLLSEKMPKMSRRTKNRLLNAMPPEQRAAYIKKTNSRRKQHGAKGQP